MLDFCPARDILTNKAKLHQNEKEKRHQLN